MAEKVKEIIEKTQITKLSHECTIKEEELNKINKYFFENFDVTLKNNNLEVSDLKFV